MWLTGRLIPDHETIADFRKDSGAAIKQVCVQFIELCRQIGLLATSSVASGPVPMQRVARGDGG
jgi:transposase